MTPGAHFYIPQLDGLRFCAFLAVFLGHVVPPVAFYGTGFGVDLFFVLSSYLITSLLIRESDSTGGIDVFAFWVRRALRIWPLYLAFVSVYVLLAGISGRCLAAFSLFAGNWAVLAWNCGSVQITHLWSVSVEEQFYIAWPLVLATLPRRFIRPACLVLIFVAVAGRYTLYLTGSDVGAVWLNSVAHLDTIGVGALIALLPLPSLSRAQRSVLCAGAVLVVVALARIIWNLLLVPAPPNQPFYVAAPATASLAFLGVASACGGLLLAALSGSKWLSLSGIRYLGRISYGLYVFHTTAIWLVADWWWVYRLPAAFAVTLAFAAVSYRFFERPFLRLKARYAYVTSEPARLPERHDFREDDALRG